MSGSLLFLPWIHLDLALLLKANEKSSTFHPLLPSLGMDVIQQRLVYQMST